METKDVSQSRTDGLGLRKPLISDPCNRNSRDALKQEEIVF